MNTNKIKDKMKFISRGWIVLIIVILTVWSFGSTIIRNSARVANVTASMQDFLINQNCLLHVSHDIDVKKLRKSSVSRFGLEEMKGSSVAFLGAGKNVGEHLPNVLKQVRLTC